MDEAYLVVGDTLVPDPRVSPPSLAAPSHDEPASESLVGVLERLDSSQVSREVSAKAAVRGGARDVPRAPPGAGGGASARGVAAAAVPAEGGASGDAGAGGAKSGGAGGGGARPEASTGRSLLRHFKLGSARLLFSQATEDFAAEAAGAAEGINASPEWVDGADAIHLFNDGQVDSIRALAQSGGMTISREDAERAFARIEQLAEELSPEEREKQVHENWKRWQRDRTPEKEEAKVCAVCIRPPQPQPACRLDTSGFRA